MTEVEIIFIFIGTFTIFQFKTKVKKIWISFQDFRILRGCLFEVLTKAFPARMFSVN